MRYGKRLQASSLSLQVQHFNAGKPETILVITDGQPDNEEEVKKAIINVTKRLKKKEELSISFVQIGSDGGATRFLDALDDDLVSRGAAFGM
jgi:hypothetical protein